MERLEGRGDHILVGPLLVPPRYAFRIDIISLTFLPVASLVGIVVPSAGNLLLRLLHLPRPPSGPPLQESSSRYRRFLFHRPRTPASPRLAPETLSTQFVIARHPRREHFEHSYFSFSFFRNDNSRRASWDLRGFKRIYAGTRSIIVKSLFAELSWICARSRS